MQCLGKRSISDRLRDQVGLCRAESPPTPSYLIPRPGWALQPSHPLLPVSAARVASRLSRWLVGQRVGRGDSQQRTPSQPLQRYGNGE